jgi:hypothetical protein
MVIKLIKFKRKTNRKRMTKKVNHRKNLDLIRALNLEVLMKKNLVQDLIKRLKPVKSLA